ncbi:hypothetical protein DFS34DRAFT_502808 [Phlyctochytrium arcticum]|nr:hypothetical protein DFS34DRAFT_502808 [Phlyctochytrium arcticum]
MPKSRELNPKPIFDEPLLLEAFAAHNINPKQAQKLWRFLIQSPNTPIASIPDLSKAALKLVSGDDAEFVLATSRVITRTDAKDGSTTKLLIELQDGQRVESVIMRYGQVELDTFPEEERKRKRIVRRLVGGDGASTIGSSIGDEEEEEHEEVEMFRSNKRATLCVSSQVGCAMGCTFCATGTMGLLSNLTAGEILEQLYHANKVEKIRNIVFMGMGEPLDNYSAVLSSIHAMIDTSRFGLSPTRISVSTVGVVPRIHALMRDAPTVGLALSLHAPTQELRQQIVPTAKAWHVDRILTACDAFIDNQNSLIKSRNRSRHILVEYVLIADINDSIEVADQLGRVLQNRSVLLNVIPYNVTDVPHDYRTPTRVGAKAFVEKVREYGVHVLLRQTMGADAASACGQLVIDQGGQKQKDKNGCEKKPAKGETVGAGGGVADMEDLIGRSSAPAKLTEIGKKNSSGNGALRRATRGKPSASSPPTSSPMSQSSKERALSSFPFSPVALILLLLMIVLIRVFFRNVSPTTAVFSMWNGSPHSDL